MKFPRLALFILPLTAALAGCAQGPEPRYMGPSGRGRLIYEPGVGITRKDALPSTDEQSLYAQAKSAYDNHRWRQTIDLSTMLTQSFPESSHAVDAILLRIHARLELGRATKSVVPHSIPLDQWMFVYLAPVYDERLQSLLSRDAETRDFVSKLRDTEIGTFVNQLATDADALYDSGQLDMAVRDCRTLVTYYLPALEIESLRRETAELSRDVTWLMYAARSFDRVISLSDDLLAMNPAPSIKADALFIQGQAQRRNGAYALAANTFGQLYNGAGLHDTDTRWRPYALMWQIRETMDVAKGHTYDVVPYENAMELLGEYELYAIENPNIPAKVHEEFVKLMNEVYDVMIERDLDAADQYSRLGQSGAAKYYTARAADWDTQRTKRILELNQYEQPKHEQPKEH